MQSKFKPIISHAFLAVGVLMLVGALYFVFRPHSSTSPETIGDFVIPEADNKFSVQGNAMGDPNAPVVIEEFSDFQCPYCRQFALQTMPLIIENYVETGKVYFVYRTLGDWLGPESQLAAEGAYCAGDQGKFWQYHDALFANQGKVSFSASNLLQMAEAMNLDMDAFASCVQDYTYREQVNQDLQEGLRAGVRGTPTFFINDKLLVGAQSFSAFQQVIETALSTAAP